MDWLFTLSFDFRKWVWPRFHPLVFLFVFFLLQNYLFFLSLMMKQNEQWVVDEFVQWCQKRTARSAWCLNNKKTNHSKMKFKQEKKKMLGERQLVYFGANIFFSFSILHLKSLCLQLKMDKFIVRDWQWRKEIKNCPSLFFVCVFARWHSSSRSLSKTPGIQTVVSRL